MRYNIGDRVKIRSSLGVWEEYITDGGVWCYTDDMHIAVKEHNFEATIIDIVTQSRTGRVGYRLDIDPERPFYCDAMIEKLLYRVNYNSADILEFLKENLA